jgi:hypothetical protein
MTVSKLAFMTNQIEEAKGSLEEALKSARTLNLPGTEREIRSALSYINATLYEIEMKAESEFAPYRADQ